MSPPVAPAVVTTDLPLPLFARGKVRDVYETDGRLLIVATDRISAFDHVLPTPVPGKGRILTRLSAFWFAQTRGIVSNHLITADPAQMPPAVRAHAVALDGRAMLVRRARRLDVECVVRGYLAGSGWRDYRRDGAICGVSLPAGLREGDRLKQPIFTPATKAASGHDENITFADVVRLVGEGLASRLREVSLALYAFAHAYAQPKDLVLADTKFEFGIVDGPAGDELILIDEALTPDSSRYWDAGDYARGNLVPLDKQFVRNYLIEIGWNHEPPPPALPPDVVAATRERYRETYRRLIGEEIAEMPTFRILIMLKPGVLDAPGQAVARGLAALDYPVEHVRVGKVIEVTVPAEAAGRIGEMCERFLANPLIETWQIEEVREGRAAGGPAVVAEEVVR